MVDKLLEDMVSRYMELVIENEELKQRRETNSSLMTSLNQSITKYGGSLGLSADEVTELQEKTAANLAARGAVVPREKKQYKIEKGVFPCEAPGCEREFDTRQGLRMHTTQKHRKVA